MHVEHLEEGLAHGKCYISVIIIQVGQGVHLYGKEKNSCFTRTYKSETVLEFSLSH